MSKRRVGIFSAIILFFMISVLSAYYIGTKESNSGKIYSDSTYSPVPSNERQLINNELSDSRQNLITETVKKVSPAVVGINVTEIQKVDPYASFFGNDPFFRHFFGDQSYNQEIKILGSGTIISSDGYIITNDHVAGNASKIVITMTNGRHYTAKKIGSDPVSDICLLKIDDNNLPFIPLGNSDDVLIGEWVIALGNPFGLFDINDQPTVTVGVISAKGMNLDPVNNRYYLGMLQTDAAINSGNSGGPLVNSVGEMIGMNTLIYTGGGAGSIGLGFAIPINKIKRIIEDIKKYGSIDRNFWIGLSAQTIDEGIAKYYNLPSTRGVIVTNVERNSPAYKAGIQVGDIIYDIDDYKIINYQSLIGVFQEFRTGQTITLKIMRDNKMITTKMTLDKKYD
jgi:serine protease Do